MSIDIDHTGYPPVGELDRGTLFSAELRGFGALITVELEWLERPRFVIRGSKYLCTVPTCWCPRTPCVGSGRWRGRCAELQSVESRGEHVRTHCHAGHARHVMLLAAEVLKTYGPNGRRVSSPAIGVLRGSRFLSRALLPLDGQEQVNFVSGWSDDHEVYHVRCDSVRCRDSEGNVRRVASDFATQSLAVRAVEEHKAWHAEQRAARLVGAR